MSATEDEFTMVGQTEAKNQAADTSNTIRSIWITLEPAELIELKRISIDRDLDEAINYFFDILWPRVHTAAIQRGIELDQAVEIKSHDHLSG